MLQIQFSELYYGTLEIKSTELPSIIISVFYIVCNFQVGGPASPVLRELRPITVDGEQCVKDVARRGQELNRPNTPPVDPEVEVCTYLGANSGMCHVRIRFKNL